MNHNNTLRRLYAEHHGKVSDKWSVYLDVYERLLSPLRGDPVRLLEIGIQNGGSLEIWAKYFPSATYLLGCDINPGCRFLQFEDPRIAVVVGDANTDHAAREISAHSAQFDIIIDDGSHRSSDIVRSFQRYFPVLSEGGIFIAEDLHCSYWRHFEGGLHDPASSLAFFRKLSDIVNHEHWGVPGRRSELLAIFLERYGVVFDEPLLASIHSLEFVNSMCVVRKAPAAANVLGARVIAGSDALVDRQVVDLALDGTFSPAADESQNPTALVRPLPEERIAALEADSDLLRSQLSASAQRLADVQVYSQSLLNRIEHANALVESATQTVHAVESREERLLLDLEAHQRHLREVLASTSWKVSAPVRWAGLQIRRTRRIAQLLPVVIRRAGGLTRLVRRIWQVAGDSGLAGLRGVLRQIEAEEIAATADVDGLRTAQRSYALWLQENDPQDEAHLSKLKSLCDGLARKPSISIVMPTYNAAPEWLEAAIQSVRSQIYPHWELCIADDASSDPSAREILEHYRALDPRVKVVYREKNGHISEASNSAIEIAVGEWMALMDHDDLLAPHALFWMADAINSRPDARLIYSDEDKVDEGGVRSDPYFKSDWNIDLFYSQNMFSHLGVFKMELVREVGGFRVGFEGSQDYDLVLRCIERVAPSQIVHVPRVLYHWRIHAQSTASSSDVKPYAQIAGERALNEHFERRGVDAHVKNMGYGYKVAYELPQLLPKVSIIIPTRNAVELVRQCIQSLTALTAYDNYEIILVDNGSDDPAALEYFDGLRAKFNFKVVRDDRPFNYSTLNNRGVEFASGDVLCLLNNDIEVVDPKWLKEMVSIALQPGVGAVGARLWYPDYTLQHGGVILGIGGVANHAHKGASRQHAGYFARAVLIQSFSAVTGACLVVQKKHYLAVGGLNEKDLAVAFNDVDFCLRLLELGLRNVWTPYAELIHHESATRGLDESPEKRARFVSEVRYMEKRWAEILSCDPAYNPNLTLNAEDFSLAWPSRLGVAKFDHG